MDGLSNGPIPDPHGLLNPPNWRWVEKSPFQVSANRLQFDENVYSAHFIIHFLIVNLNNRTAFAKAPNDWTQFGHNMCGCRAAWSPLGWWPCWDYRITFLRPVTVMELLTSSVSYYSVLMRLCDCSTLLIIPVLYIRCNCCRYTFLPLNFTVVNSDLLFSFHISFPLIFY